MFFCGIQNRNLWNKDKVENLYLLEGQIEKAENLDYVGAIEFLAARAGVSIPQYGKQAQPGEIPRRRIYDMNLAAAKFFRECLFDPAIGGEGMKYLSPHTFLKFHFPIYQVQQF